MIQNVLWVISFFSLWLVIIWLQIIYNDDADKRHGGKNSAEKPMVTLAVAAYNEEKTITKTLNSFARLDYPMEKLEVIVVDDGSTDKTADVVTMLIKKHKLLKIRLISKENGGKASAINVALKNAKGELFGVVDADSRVEPNCLNLICPHFDNENVGAVISRIKVDVPKRLLEKMQKFEYIMSNMIRNLMARIGTLALTPGVLSAYRTSILSKVGGFDDSRENLTEDLEIAMRLKYLGYRVEMEPRSITHTVVPQNIRRLWRQRIRWSRGFIYNHWKYRKMFFSRKHSLFGIFQMPVNVLVVILLIVNMAIIGYMLLSKTVEFAIRSFTIDGYLVDSLLDFPTLKGVILGQNARILLPIIISSVLGVYLIIMTHRIFKERLSSNIFPVVSYFIFLPYFMTLNWLSSIAQELMKTRKKW